MLTTLHKFLKMCCIAFILTIQPLTSKCTDNHKAGARAAALSNAAISLSDIWASFHNQAALALIDNLSAGFFHDSKFNINKLSTTACSVIVPVNRGVFGISVLQFGKSSCSENKFGIAFAKGISEKWNAGIQIDYFSLLYPENPQYKGVATFEGGVLFSPNSNISFGAHIFNPVAEGITMPVIVRAGCHYLFSNNLMFIVETEKENRFPAVIKTALEFFPVEQLALRFGASGKPIKYSSGIGYILNKYSADISFGYHANLGITPSLSIQITL